MSEKSNIKNLIEGKGFQFRDFKIDVKTRAAEEADDGKRKVFELHNRVSASESESKGYENLKKTLLRRREELEELRDENSEADRRQIRCRQP